MKKTKDMSIFYKFIYEIIILFIAMGIVLLLEYLYFKNTKKILKRKEK